jgi:hypothetical protein
MPKPDIVPDELALKITPDKVILLHRAVELLQKQLAKSPGFDYHNNNDAAPGEDMARQLIKTGEQLLWLKDFDQSLTSYCHAKGYRPYPHFRYQ